MGAIVPVNTGGNAGGASPQQHMEMPPMGMHLYGGPPGMPMSMGGMLGPIGMGGMMGPMGIPMLGDGSGMPGMGMEMLEDQRSRKKARQEKGDKDRGRKA